MLDRSPAMAPPIFAALALVALTGCDALECGPGTHRDGAECVADAPVGCGEGTVLMDGRCVIDESDAPDASTPPPCADDEIRDESGTCVPRQIDYIACADGPAAPAPGCGALEPGEYCVTGTLVDTVTGCPLGPDSGLAVSLSDPIAVLRDPDTPPLAVAVPGEGGGYALVASGTATYLVIAADEADPQGDDAYVRSVTGVIDVPPVAGDTYERVALATAFETLTAWATALERDDDIAAEGFLVGRALAEGEDGALAPAAGVRVGAEGRDNYYRCEVGVPCLRMFDDDPALTGFQPVATETTGESGAFLLISNGAPSLLLNLEADGDYDPISTGASAGRGFHAVFVPAP